MWWELTTRRIIIKVNHKLDSNIMKKDELHSAALT